jgi:hypothetical protein
MLEQQMDVRRDEDVQEAAALHGEVVHDFAMEGGIDAGENLWLHCDSFGAEELDLDGLVGRGLV